MLLFFGLTEQALIQRNVIFQKVNEVTTTRSRWLITFVTDLEPYEKFMSKMKDDFSKVGESISMVEKMTAKTQGFIDAQTFFNGPIMALKQELVSLRVSYENSENMFVTFKSLQHRSRRSLIPFIGSALSFLFGTVSDQDLNSIRRNVHTLSQNQNKIAHVVTESLTILNSTRIAVNENRVEINTLADGLQALEARFKSEKDQLIRGIVELASFTHAYMQMDRLIARIETFMQKAMSDMKQLQLQLNMLSLGHLSPSTISPNEFRQLLREVQSHLPYYLKLPSDPETDLWDFYNILTCHTALDGNHIYTVVSVPLLDENSKYEIFKVHNLPLPMNSTFEKLNAGMIAKYSLESQAIAVNGDKTRYVLLNDMELHQCANPFQKFCKIDSPIYPINLSELCVIALFVGNTEKTNNFCKTMISPSSTLPLATYLFNGVWVIATLKILRFTVVCQQAQSQDSLVEIKPPFGIIHLSTSCTASNDYLYLPPFYHNESKYEISDPFNDLNALFNISRINLWKPLLNKLPNFNSIKLPKRLKSLDEMPIEHFIHELNSLTTVNSELTGKTPVWVWVLIGLAVLVGIILAVFIWWKITQVGYFSLANGKSSIVRSVKHARCAVLPTDVGSDGGLEGRMTEIPSAPLMLAEAKTNNNVGDTKTVYPKLDLLTVKT